MQVVSTHSGKNFEFRLSSTFNPKGSELRGEVLILGEWRHADCFLNFEKREITVMADIPEANGKLTGVITERSEIVDTWMEMKISNKKKHDQQEKDYKDSQMFGY